MLAQSSNDMLKIFVVQLVDFDGSIKSWECLEDQLQLKNNVQFQCWQIKHAISQLWKIISKTVGNISNFSFQDHHLIKCHRIFNLEKLYCRELFNIYLSLNYEIPTCLAYHEKKFDNYSFGQKIIYSIPCIAT